jgi:hypothetical protein
MQGCGIGKAAMGRAQMRARTFNRGWHLSSLRPASSRSGSYNQVCISRSGCLQTHTIPLKSLTCVFTIAVNSDLIIYISDCQCLAIRRQGEHNYMKTVLKYSTAVRTIITLAKSVVKQGSLGLSQAHHVSTTPGCTVPSHIEQHSPRNTLVPQTVTPAQWSAQHWYGWS